jgi:hypothetical protein
VWLPVNPADLNRERRPTPGVVALADPVARTPADDVA